jgi:hypothetical protein
MTEPPSSTAVEHAAYSTTRTNNKMDMFPFHDLLERTLKDKLAMAKTEQSVSQVSGQASIVPTAPEWTEWDTKLALNTMAAESKMYGGRFFNPASQLDLHRDQISAALHDHTKRGCPDQQTLESQDCQEGFEVITKIAERLAPAVHQMSLAPWISRRLHNQRAGKPPTFAE